MIMATDLNSVNDFMVSSTADRKVVTILDLPIGGRMTRDEALRLAAWLVAVADPGGKDFAKVLEAVRET